MIIRRLVSLTFAVILATGTIALPANAAPSSDDAATWIRDAPVLNPSHVASKGDYFWQSLTTSGVNTVNDWPGNWHWVMDVSWTDLPSHFVENTPVTLKISSEISTKGKSGGIDANANWGWDHGFSGSVSDYHASAVCAGSCGQSAEKVVDVTLPTGVAFDAAHPENNPVLWVTVDGHTAVSAHYSRAGSSPPPASSASGSANPPAAADSPGPPPAVNNPPPAATNVEPETQLAPSIDQVYVLHVGAISKAIFSSDPAGYFGEIDSLSGDPVLLSSRITDCYTETDNTPGLSATQRIVLKMSCFAATIANLKLPDDSLMFPRVNKALPVLLQMGLNSQTDPSALTAEADLLNLLMQQDLADDQ